jgi:hypothetical protein
MKASVASSIQLAVICTLQLAGFGTPPLKLLLDRGAAEIGRSEQVCVAAADDTCKHLGS